MSFKMAKNKQTLNESLFKIFQNLDGDKNGSISRAELRRMLVTKKYLTSSEVDVELEKLDLDYDGKVAFIGKKILVFIFFLPPKN